MIRFYNSDASGVDMTEYFVFPNVKRTLRDLLEMEPKVPSNVELDVRVRGECDRQKTT